MPTTTPPPPAPRVLVIGSGNEPPGTIVEAVAAAGHRVEVAQDVAEALALIGGAPAAVVVAHGAEPAFGLHIDPVSREARIDGRRVDLTPTEFELLRLIAAAGGRTVTRERIVGVLWGVRWTGDQHALDVHISKLRGKLREAGTLGVTTVHGVGYRLDRG